MENQNELSDIVLEKSSADKAQKLKKILLISAILVLLFLVIIIIVKAFNSSDDQQQLALPPEPQTSTSINASDDKIFQQVPIIKEEQRDSFEDVVKKLKSEPKVEPTPVVEQPKVVEVVEPKVEPKPVVVQPTTPQVQAPIVTPPTTTQSATPAGIYIQVASVARANPDARFIKTLTDKSYNYALHRTEVSGQTVTKVLVGPYNDANSAREALGQIKSDVAPNAFIFRVK